MEIIMIGPDIKVKGGISSVIKGYSESDLFKVHHVRLISSYLDYNCKLNKMMKALVSYFVFIIAIIRKKPDIVHIHTSFGASFYRKSFFFIVSKLLRIKLINHIHGAEFDRFYMKAGTTKKRLVSWIYQMADATFVLSESWKKLVIPIVGNHPIMVLKNFAQSTIVNSSYSGRDEIVVFMGELGQRKGGYDLPGIIKKVCAIKPSVKFLLCGNGDIHGIRNKIEFEKLDRNVTVLGWVSGDEKVKLLNNCKLFLLPSYDEGMPMAIIEAMSFGIPIVSSTIGGIPELVEPGVNGYLAKPGDIDSFSSFIIKIMNNIELGQFMSDNNIEKIYKEYSLEKAVKSLDHYYKLITSINK